MATEKQITNVRVIQKHAKASEWEQAKNFIPKKGELIVYLDDNYENEPLPARFKVGDDKHNINALKFSGVSMEEVTDAITTSIEGINIAEPNASGISTTFVSSLKQVKGKIELTKASVPTANGSTLGMVYQAEGSNVSITNGKITVNNNGHTHTIANVTGLQAALDAKATSSDITEQIDAITGENVSCSTSEYISAVSQTKGKVSASKTSFPLATTSQNGFVSTGTQTFAGNKTFNGSVQVQGVVTVKHSINPVITFQPMSQSGLGQIYALSSNSQFLFREYAIVSSERNGYYEDYYLPKPTTTSGNVSYNILTSKDYTTYVPTKTGVGASGTWGISISGNAATATKATQDGNGATISSTYVKIAGSTMTGNLNWSCTGFNTITSPNSNSDVGFKAINSNGVYTSLLIGGGGVNHGVYSGSLANWLIYATASDAYIPKWASVGSSSTPVYFNSSGRPVVCTLNYKVVQIAVSSPSASGTTTAFIDTISQDAQGKITATKKNILIPTSGSWWNNGLTQVQTNGVMEIGRYIDFHGTSATTKDFDIRIDAGTTAAGNTLYLPDVTGQLVVHTNNTAVGSGTKPVYIAASGQATASSSTVGSSSLPVYLNAGTITACGTSLAVSITGNAATATKWATARTLTVGNQSVSLDGGSDQHLQFPLKYAVYGSDTANTAGWYKVGTWSLSGHNDHNAILAVMHGYGTRGVGLFQFGVRCDNGTTLLLKKFRWLVRTSEFASNHFYWKDNGDNTYSIYVYQATTQYGRITIDVISEMGTACKTTMNWTLSSNTTVESPSPTGGIHSTDAGIVNHANSAGWVDWSNVGNKPSYYDSKAIKSISRSGTTFTYTCLDGTTGTFTQQDNNTTYSAGTGLSLSGTTFSVKTGYTTSGKNYKVQADSSGNLYVNVPWTDTTYSSLKNPNALTVQFNGTTNATYDGSSAKTVNITPSAIGAAASSHTHSYLPLAGGTLTGNVTSSYATPIANASFRNIQATTGTVTAGTTSLTTGTILVRYV